MCLADRARTKIAVRDMHRFAFAVTTLRASTCVRQPLGHNRPEGFYRCMHGAEALFNLVVILLHDTDWLTAKDMRSADGV
jgi:hypothetical protein